MAEQDMTPEKKIEVNPGAESKPQAADAASGAPSGDDKPKTTGAPSTAKPSTPAARPASTTRPAGATAKPGTSTSAARPGAPRPAQPRPASTSTSTNKSVAPRPTNGAPTSRPPQRPASGAQRPSAPPSNPSAPRPTTPGTIRPTSSGKTLNQAPRPAAPRPATGARPPSTGGHSGSNSRPGGQRPNGQRPGSSGNRSAQRPGSNGAPRPAQPAAPVKVAPPAPPQPITLPPLITVRDLAILLKLTPIDIIKKLMMNGVMANITQSIDFDTAALIAGELGFEVHEEKVEVVEEEVTILSSIPKKQEYSEEELKHMKVRPPIVTVMGHVDHGKTSLLDAVRNTNVVAGEFGGITQHIGAYQTEHDGKKITFLDTPGHEAFTAMRARGAQATDLAIIVVAADDGVMPTTREAIDHARAARVPIIIALNKIDRPNANPERVKQQLSDMGLEVYGGKDEVTVVPISAKQRIGLDDLLENVLLVAELADLRADPDKLATGVVIESRLDKQQGPTATLLVREGTLHVGDVVLAGETYGKVRALFNERGEIVNEVLPATPAVVTGLSDMPSAGDVFSVVGAEQIARARAAERVQARREKETKTPAITLTDLYAKFQEGAIKELNLIIKADVAGSLEPIVSSLEKLGDSNIKVKVIRQGNGSVTQADVMLATASQGIIIAFNTAVEAAAETLAAQENVDIRKYNIIYKLIEDVDKALKGMLEPEYKDVLIGRAQVLKLFSVRKNQIAGSRVIKGTIARNATAHVLRDGKELFKGPLSSLKRFTDDVKEVADGYECGISLDGFDDLKEGDLIEFYRKERVS